MRAGRWIGILAAACALAAGTPAAGDLLAFEPFPAGPPAFPLVDGFFEVTSLGAGHEIAAGPGACLPACPEGTGAYFIHSGEFGLAGTVTIARADGRPFSVRSIDLAEHAVGGPFADAVLLVSSKGSHTLSLDGINDGPGPAQDFQRFALGGPDFTGVTSFGFTQTASLGTLRFSVDNVWIEPDGVPALPPLALAGLAAALAAAGAHATQRRASAPRAG